MPFLTAEWRKLALANYEVDPSILRKYIPYKTELDLWNNTCYVSLVGFMFLNTKLVGLSIPFHRNFEEVNLRFYVRYKDKTEWKRGVVFIKEIVPKAAITFVANTIYGEHYQTLKMSHRWEENDLNRNVAYSWRHKNTNHSISVKADREPCIIAPGSETEFITEHYWGYTKLSENETYEYEVTHPKWQHYPVQDYRINVDFGEIYGQEFSALTHLEPISVMLAEGSAITVESKKQL